MGDGLALEIVGVDFGAAGSRRLGSWGFGVGRLHHFDFPQKAVTAARHRLDITRSFGRFSQRVAQPSNGVVDRRVELDHRFIWPKLIANLRSHYEFAGMLQQRSRIRTGCSRNWTRIPCFRSSPERTSSSNSPKRYRRTLARVESAMTPSRSEYITAPSDDRK